MAKNKTVHLNCTLEDGKISRKPGERANLPEALAKSLAGLGLVEILDPVAAKPPAKIPPAGAPDAAGGDTGSGDAGADAGADSADAGKEDEANG